MVEQDLISRALEEMSVVESRLTCWAHSVEKSINLKGCLEKGDSVATVSGLAELLAFQSELEAGVVVADGVARRRRRCRRRDVAGNVATATGHFFKSCTFPGTSQAVVIVVIVFGQ